MKILANIIKVVLILTFAASVIKSEGDIRRLKIKNQESFLFLYQKLHKPDQPHTHIYYSGEAKYKQGVEELK